MEVNRNNYETDITKKCFSKNYTFNSPYFQNFSIPRNIIFYVLKNPKSLNGYQKLVKTCKYFFSSNPIVVIDYASIMEICWVFRYGNKFIDGNFDTFQKYSFKFWLVNGIKFKNLTSSNFSTFLIRNLFLSNVSQIELGSGLIFVENLIIFKTFENLNFVKFTECLFLYANGKKTVSSGDIEEFFSNDVALYFDCCKYF